MKSMSSFFHVPSTTKAKNPLSKRDLSTLLAWLSPWQGLQLARSSLVLLNSRAPSKASNTIAWNTRSTAVNGPLVKNLSSWKWDRKIGHSHGIRTRWKTVLTVSISVCSMTVAWPLTPFVAPIPWTISQQHQTLCSKVQLKLWTKVCQFTLRSPGPCLRLTSQSLTSVIWMQTKSMSVLALKVPLPKRTLRKPASPSSTKVKVIKLRSIGGPQRQECKMSPSLLTLQASMLILHRKTTSTRSRLMLKNGQLKLCFVTCQVR